MNDDDERNELLAQLAACQERLAAYVDVVADVVERLGHEGSEPGDLLDALGEIEGMFTGKFSCEPHDLAGLAEVCRLALWHRDRARLLLADARNTCEQRAAERDQAILERDAVARELARVLALQEPPTKITPSMVKELRERTHAEWQCCVRALQETDGDIDRAVEHLRKQGLA